MLIIYSSAFLLTKSNGKLISSSVVWHNLYITNKNKNQWKLTRKPNGSFSFQALKMLIKIEILSMYKLFKNCVLFMYFYLRVK
jgi:hypothetical protein